jgi:hypothetical protein
MLAKDKDFLAWRAEHPESYVPRRVAHRARSARRPSNSRTASMQGHVPSGGTASEASA